MTSISQRSPQKTPKPFSLWKWQYEHVASRTTGNLPKLHQHQRSSWEIEKEKLGSEHVVSPLDRAFLQVEYPELFCFVWIYRFFFFLFLVKPVWVGNAVTCNQKDLCNLFIYIFIVQLPFHSLLLLFVLIYSLLFFMTQPSSPWHFHIFLTHSERTITYFPLYKRAHQGVWCCHLMTTFKYYL